MLTNAQIKSIRKLRDKKFRDETGLFIVEGEKMLDEALRSGWKVELVVRSEEVGQKVMDQLSLLSTAPGVLALVHKPVRECVDTGCGGLFLGLDRVSDPGNFGTIIRIADWFGLDGIFVSEDTVEEFNPKVVQASMGSIFRIPVFRGDLVEACERFENVYGTFLDGEDIYGSELKVRNSLIIMGNESNGISDRLKSQISNKLLIPSYNGSRAESLNVGVATALTVAEFRRRG